jgi:hypothetical protein
MAVALEGPALAPVPLWRPAASLGGFIVSSACDAGCAPLLHGVLVM